MVTFTDNPDGTITIGFGDNFADIGKGLRELPEITSEEADKAVACLVKQFAKMNRRSKAKAKD